MEDNNSSIPEFCSNGCGFFGNPIFNNMCSQCYKKYQQSSNAGSDKMTPNAPEAPSSTQIPSNSSTQLEKSTATEPNKPLITESSPITEETLTPSQSSTSPSEISATTPSVSTADTAAPAEDAPVKSKPIQTNKGRCFSCRVKIPLAKQQINKCRCDYVFCDAHRYPDEHGCEFDYAGTGRQQLAKSNPKLNERPKGGRSFQRINSN